MKKYITILSILIIVLCISISTTNSNEQSTIFSSRQLEDSNYLLQFNNNNITYENTNIVPDYTFETDKIKNVDENVFSLNNHNNGLINILYTEECSEIANSKYEIIISSCEHNVLTKNIEENNTLILDPTLDVTYSVLTSSKDNKFKVEQLLVTPYTKDTDNNYIPLAYSEEYDNTQIEQYIRYEKYISYVPKEPYSDINYISGQVNELTVIDKNLCLSPEFEPLVESYIDIYPYSEYQVTEVVHEPLIEFVDSLNQTYSIEMQIKSSYRDYEYQETLYNDYSYESSEQEADEYSARPGCSEHQTGLVVDVITPTYDGELTDLNGTTDAQAIKELAPQYGFIVRYPEDKTQITQYSYESWHLRYVGKENSVIIDYFNITLEEYVNNYDYYNAIYSYLKK